MFTRAAHSIRATAARVHTTSVRHGSKSSGYTAQVTAVLGAQWGDEGKGKLSDVLAEKYHVIARFNGGANAGHTVVVGDKKFAFHLLPCGLVYPHTKNLIGNGVVVHLPSLMKELEPLEAAGISNARQRLFVSDRAHVLFDFHKTVDGLLEERRKGAGGSIGTTKQGIGPAYASKATRHGVRIGDLCMRTSLHTKVRRLVDDMRQMYSLDIDAQAEIDKLDALVPQVQPMVVDGTAWVASRLAAGDRLLAEGANAAMLDLDFGTYPYVTSSSTTIGGVSTGLGIAPSLVQARVGVVKAYTTRVGGGPFPSELTDARGGGERPLHADGTDTGLHLQTVGGEVGVTTGRKRRCGWFDAVVVRYAHALNAFTSLNVTKLDVLDDLPDLRIATRYSTAAGADVPPHAYPASLEELAAVTVHYDTLPGWKTSTRGVKRFADLPPNAKAYVRAIEKAVGVPVAWIGTGPARDEMILRGFKATDM